MVLNYILVGCPCVYYDKILKHWLESWVWLASHVTLWIIIIIIMNFIQVSCLVAQAQCLTNWGDCGLLYNAYLKNLQPFTRKGQRFFFSPFLPSVTWSQFCSGTLSGVRYSQLILLFLEPAFLRHFSAHVLSLNMHSK